MSNKNSPLPGFIENTDKKQSSMSYVKHCYIYCILKQYHVSRSNIEFLCPSYILCFKRAPCMCFRLGCGRTVLGPSVKYPQCQNWKKKVYIGECFSLVPRSFWLLWLRKHTALLWQQTCTNGRYSHSLTTVWWSSSGYTLLTSSKYSKIVETWFLNGMWNIDHKR